MLGSFCLFWENVSTAGLPLLMPPAGTAVLTRLLKRTVPGGPTVAPAVMDCSPSNATPINANFSNLCPTCASLDEAQSGIRDSGDCEI